MRHAVTVVVVAVVLAGCGGGATASQRTVRAGSQALDDALRAMGSTAAQVDDAFVLSDDLSRLRALTGVTDDQLAVVAQSLDDSTPLVASVSRTSRTLSPENARTATEIACELYDAASWVEMSDEQRLQYVLDRLRQEQQGTARQITDAVEDLVMSYREGTLTSSAITRVLTCTAVGVAD